MIKTLLQLMHRFHLATAPQLQLPSPSGQSYRVSPVVYFGGIYERDAGLISEDGEAPEDAQDVKIDFYTRVNDELLPLPGIVSDPGLIEVFSQMQRGQAFVITKESSWGPMGTRIEGIKLENSFSLRLDQELIGQENAATDRHLVLE